MKVSPAKTCSVEVCEEIVFCRGMCKKHYGRWWANARKEVKRPSSNKKVSRRLENDG